MENLDPVQRHQRIEPLFSYHLHEYGSQTSDNESSDNFNQYLENAFEDTESLPEDLENSYAELKRLRVYSDEEIFILAMNFNQHGLQLMHDINMRVLAYSYERELMEKELLRVINALFILVVQYGSAMALQALADIWHSIYLESTLNNSLRTHFVYLASSQYPLIPYRHLVKTSGGPTPSEKQYNLKTFLKDVLLHRLKTEKATPILNQFKE